MALMKPSEDWAMTAEKAAQRPEHSYSIGPAAQSELRLRNAVEQFLRDRRATARICHEMVMGEREVRADVVAVDTDHIVAVEVKGESDSVSRLLHQVGMFQLCVPEVWIITAKPDHVEASQLINYLLPSVGVIAGTGIRDRWERGNRIDALKEPCVLTVLHEAVPRAPHPEMVAQMLWARELANIATRTRLMVFAPSKIPSRQKCIGVLLEKLSAEELLREACTELRARRALWRADDPVKAA